MMDAPPPACGCCSNGGHSVVAPLQEVLIVDVQIEVPKGSRVKYELDKAGKLRVNRFLPTPIDFPFNYGCVPETLAGDGDCLDAVVLTEFTVASTAFVECRVIALLRMEDEEGNDDKLICVPVKDFRHARVSSIADLPPLTSQELIFFFQQYKKLETGKWTQVLGLQDVRHAIQILAESRARYHAAPVLLPPAMPDPAELPDLLGGFGS